MPVDAPLPTLDIEEQPVRLLPPLEEANCSIPAIALPPIESPAPEEPIGRRWNTGLLASAGIAATSVFITQPPRSPTLHEGKFQLIIDSPTSKLGHSAVQSAIAAPEIDYETQARVLWSPKLIAPVVRRLQAQYPELNNDAVLQNLQVVHEPNSNRLLVTYQDANAEKVRVILKELAQDYAQYSRVCRSGSCRAIQLIDRQLPQFRQQMTKAQQKLQSLQQLYGSQPLEQFGQTLNQRVQANTQQKNNTQIQLTVARARASTLQRQLGQNQAVVDRLLQNNAPYQSLLSQFQTVAVQLATELGQSQINVDRVKLLREQYTQLTRELSESAQAAVVQNASVLRSKSIDPTAAQFQTLQQSADVTRQIQMLTISQQALTQVEQRLQSLVKQWAGSSLSYAQAQQEFKTARRNLELYQARRVKLQAQQPQISVQAVILPES